MIKHNFRQGAVYREFLYIFDPKTRILGSGTIAIGFGSKFRADSRYRDPEIFVLKPFRAFFDDFLRIETDMFQTLFEKMNFSWLLWKKC